MGSLFLPPGPDVHTMCVLSKCGVSVTPSLVEVLQSNPPSLQSLILWEFLLPLPDPQVGMPDVGLSTFNPVGGLLWYNCSPVCESLTHGYGIWFDCDCALTTVSLRLRLCLCLWGIFFCEFQYLPVNECPAVICDSSALLRGSEHTSFYSAILNQSTCSPTFFKQHNFFV